MIQQPHKQGCTSQIQVSLNSFMIKLSKFYSASIRYRQVYTSVHTNTVYNRMIDCRNSFINKVAYIHRGFSLHNLHICVCIIMISLLYQELRPILFNILWPTLDAQTSIVHYLWVYSSVHTSFTGGIAHLLIDCSPVDRFHNFFICVFNLPTCYRYNINVLSL